ncbi:MAG TPA: LON peptidase substrate-binding domain-containing protein [Pyrinomonadaceae bacterium]|nr:LON peptidase substrate-binding domain-containing protein [Pyrinomonadaceae bacterium]
MDDPILNSDELNDKSAIDDDNIAFVINGTIHKKIIPILLSPKVIFPFQTSIPVVTDPHLKQLFEEAHRENTVIGYAYHPETAATELPKLQHVGVAAIVPELSKLVDGSYLVKIVPLNRFYITAYVNDDPKDLTARVAYYSDVPEDEKLLKPLAEKFVRLHAEVDEAIKEHSKPKTKHEAFLDPSDYHMLSLYANTSFSLFPKFTEDEKQYLLWLYKLSERLLLAIDILEETLPGTKRAAKRMRPFKNN